MTAPLLTLLACLLGHETHSVREAAEAALERAGGLAVPALTWAAGSADPERSARASRLLDPWQDAPWPYLDALPFDYPDRAGILWGYLKRAKDAGYAERDGWDWPAYREACRLWLADGGNASLLPVMRARTCCYDCTGRWSLD